jgi:hypothetical protein
MTFSQDFQVHCANESKTIVIYLHMKGKKLDAIHKDIAHTL